MNATKSYTPADLPFSEKDQIWRSILYRTRYAIVSLAVLAILLTLLTFPQDSTYHRIVVDVVLLLAVIYLLFNPAIDQPLRAKAICLIIYVTAINSLMSGGLHNGATLWLLAFSVLSAGLIGRKFGYFAIGLSFFTVLIYGLLFSTDSGTGSLVHSDSTIRVFEHAIDMLLLAFIATVPTASYFSGLESLARREKKLVTDQKKLIDEVIAINNGLKTFSMALTHDLNNPMNRLTHWTNILKEQCDERNPEMIKKGFAAIQASVDQMNKTMNGLMSLSRVENRPVERVETDISLLALSIVREFRQEETGVDVSVEIEKEISVETDETLVHVLLQNLLQNAFKFSAKAVAPRVEFGRTEEEAGRTVFFVRDNGIGFSMEESSRLFEPLSRLSSAAGYCGTGLGLSIAQRAVQRLGGEIWAKSAEGEGATFYFTLHENCTAGEA